MASWGAGTTGRLGACLRTGCALLAGTIVVASCDSGSSTPTGSPERPGPAGSASVVAGWPVYGHDLSNTRTNLRETEIDPRSVDGLSASWSKGGMVGVTATPVVVGGVVYFGDWTGTVSAVRSDGGQTVWSTKLGGGTFIGSVAANASSIFAAAGKTLYALDRVTGSIRWQAVTNPDPYSQIDASPVVVGSLVLMGTAQLEEVVGRPPFTFRGSIGAFDASTGRQVWNFYTTPNDATSGAGEGVWSTPAVDPRLGVLYVGTGQNLDEPSGPLADSLLAIDLHSGRLVWSHQFDHPDVFSTANFSGKDADVGASPNLWTSSGVPMVGVGSKNGTYYAFDRRTGKLRWETHLAPGSTFGGALGSAAVAADVILASTNIGDPVSNATTNRSKVLALDPTTGRVLWSRALSGNVFGPISAVRGVAFVGTDTGTMDALDTGEGRILWSYTAPARVGGGAAIVDAQVLWGYGFTLFQGPGQGGIIDFGVRAAGRVRQERR